MKRYFRILLVLSEMALKVFVQFRANTVGIVISTSIWSLLVLSTIYLTTRQVKTVFGYSPGELLALAAVQVIFLGLFHTLISKNIEKMPEYINQGFLDSILLKPIDSQFIVSLTHINFPALFRMMIGIVALWYLASTGAITINGIYGVLGFASTLAMGFVLIYSIWYAFATLLIWFPQMDNIVEFLYLLNTASRYPVSFYREFGLFLVIMFSPFSMALTVPLQILMGNVDANGVLSLALTSIIFFAASRWFWFYALRHYTSASV